MSAELRLQLDLAMPVRATMPRRLRRNGHLRKCRIALFAFTTVNRKQKQNVVVHVDAGRCWMTVLHNI
jgi:hypothetical protein